MNRIKDLRMSKGLNQKELAKELEIAQPTLSGWETGRTQIDYDNLIKLADYFGVSIDYLLGHSLTPFSADVVEIATIPPDRDKTEKEIMAVLDALPPDMKKIALAQLKAMAATYNGNEENEQNSIRIPLRDAG